MKKYLVFNLILFFAVSHYTIAQRGLLPEVAHRQVHLDFHTSEHIPGIGEKFDKKQFQEALKIGNVNHINIFSKGCHSWSYYPTKVGQMHPNLEFDLMGAQIEACHEIGVKCPIYYIIGWSNNDAENHPEWCAQDIDGKYITNAYDLNAKASDKMPFSAWRTLCWLPGGTYHQYILDQVEEICQNYEVDGFFFDMYHILPACYCQNCRARYRSEGIDINDRGAVEKSMAVASKKHIAELRNLLHKYHPDASLYCNATANLANTEVFRHKLYELNTEQDLEDLPTTWAGYDRLPLQARYHLGEGSTVVAQTGKFHKAWGEFGGFKHPDALKYEAAAMIAYGASCNIGDQLHPSGLMDLETYRNIGEAYAYVKKIEDYGPGGVPTSKLGVWVSLDAKSDRGVTNMLLEMHYDFVVANLDNLNQLELLVIPSSTVLSDEELLQLENWVAKGGKLIVFGPGLMNASRDEFLMDLGVTYIAASDYSFDYTVAGEDLSANIVKSPFLNYQSAMWLELAGAKKLASIREPYFDRTYERYSSHRETPYKLEDSKYPAITQKGNTILFAHEMDKLYFRHGVRLHRELFKNAIDLLYEAPFLQVKNLPSAGRVSFLKQESDNRYVAHLLYSPAIMRGEVQVIEDFPIIGGVEIIIDVPEKVRQVVQVPGDKKLKYKREGGKLRIEVPDFKMHTAIVLKYQDSKE